MIKLSRFAAAISIFFVAGISLIFSPPCPVRAETDSYFRVLSKNAYVYADPELSEKLFIVPETYYVKAETYNSVYARVVYGDDDGEYPVIVGYMSSENLTASAIVPSSPFAVIKVSSLYSDVLFQDAARKRALFNVPCDSFMYLYGSHFSNGSELCYVYYRNKLGYIDKNSLSDFVIPKNKDPLPVENEPLNNNEISESPKTRSSISGETLQIIIIVGISVVSISVVYVLFKPQKNKVPVKDEDFFEESE